MTEGSEATQTVAARAHTKPRDASMPEYIGPYRLVEEIASGGMGTVYLAVRKLDDRVKKVVALKTIHPHLAKQPGFVEMFLDEASIAARISHPNAATIVDFGDADGCFYLAMEYLRGEPFDAVLEQVKKEPSIRRNPGYPLLIAHVAAEAAEGIHALHELRDADGRLLEAVHRDISPHNILIGYDGRITVLDFGVARSKDKVHQTETGEIRGKVAYVSPEQMHGEPAERRSDIWSLGVVLWEAIALRSLFRRTTPVDTILAVRGAPIDAVSEHYPLVDPALEEVLALALNRKVEARHKTADDFASALRAVAQKGDGRRGVANLMRQLFPDGETAHHERLLRAQSASIRPQTGLHNGRLRARVALVATALLSGISAYFLLAEGSNPGPKSAELGPRVQSTVPEASFQIAPLEAASFDASVSPAGHAKDAKALNDASDAAGRRNIAARRPRRPHPSRRPSRRLRAYAKQKASTPEAPATGTLNIVTPGGWAILLDEKGKRLGRTPLSVKLAAGSHRLTLVPFGDPSKKQKVSVRVRADQPTRKAVPLSP